MHESVHDRANVREGGGGPEHLPIEGVCVGEEGSLEVKKRVQVGRMLPEGGAQQSTEAGGSLKEEAREKLNS